MTDDDARLRALLAPADRSVDRGFVNLVVCDVEIERHLRNARRTSWNRFAVDVATAGSVLAPAWLASNIVAAGHGPGPGLILMIIIGSCGFLFRPAALAFR